MRLDEESLAATLKDLEKRFGNVDRNLLGDLTYENKGDRTFLGFDSCESNVLAERDDSVVKSLCHDA